MDVLPNHFQMVFEDNELLRAEREADRTRIAQLEAGTAYDHGFIEDILRDYDNAQTELAFTKQALVHAHARLKQSDEEKYDDTLTGLPNRRWLDQNLPA